MVVSATGRWPQLSVIPLYWRNVSLRKDTIILLDALSRTQFQWSLPQLANHLCVMLKYLTAVLSTAAQAADSVNLCLLLLLFSLFFFNIFNYRRHISFIDLELRRMSLCTPSFYLIFSLPPIIWKILKSKSSNFHPRTCLWRSCKGNYCVLPVFFIFHCQSIFLMYWYVCWLS